MITRSNLVEQLREYQIRSQHKWAALIVFSPEPHITNRTNVIVARLWALLFSALVMTSYMTLYFKHFRISVVVICFGILLPTFLRISRHRRLARKRKRRLLLPLSM